MAILFYPGDTPSSAFLSVFVLFDRALSPLCVHVLVYIACIEEEEEEEEEELQQ